LTDLETVSADLAALKKDVANLIAHLGADAADRVQSAAQDASAQASKGAQMLSREVDTHPMTALAMAFAIGFAANRLLMR
jgi:ElaB/YqjD/DUF883 family membrane-anchored ribosome-binding protein